MRPLAILVLTMVLAAGMASPATSADEALQPPIADAEQDVSDDYDPWQRFNEKMFFFNHDILDRYVLKPGLVGFLDVARAQLHIEKSDADTGETLGVYGLGPGPYLVLPALKPLTVRDGIGYGVDGLLDPFGYVTPFLATTGISIVKQVNERSLNLQIFQDVEDSVLDLYSAVRNGYLQRRRRLIEEADAARQAEWHPPSRAVAAR